LYFLIWRDIKVRYKQTVLGAAWAIIQPIMTMVIFSLIFGGLAKMPSDGIPYPIFSYTALVPWSFFANGLGRASNSLVGSGALIKKIYFPRLVIPIVGVLGGIVDFALSFVVLLVLMLIYHITPTANIIWLPAFLLLAFATALGVGLWLTAMNVQFRDVNYLVPFLTQFWMYATPIVYPSSLIQNPVLKMVYGINPMSGVIEGFRWALLSSPPHYFLPGLDALGYHWGGMSVGAPPGPMIVVSSLVTLALLISGAFYFRRMEKTFADVV
jgi:lipopolysaccharide transport system permease protein